MWLVSFKLYSEEDRPVIVHIYSAVKQMVVLFTACITEMLDLDCICSKEFWVICVKSAQSGVEWYKPVILLFAMHPLTVRWCSIFHAGPLRGPVQSITILNLTVFMIIPLSYCYSYCTLWFSVSAAVVWPPPAEEQTVMLCEKFAVNCDFHSSFLCAASEERKISKCNHSASPPRH